MTPAEQAVEAGLVAQDLADLLELGGPTAVVAVALSAAGLDPTDPDATDAAMRLLVHQGMGAATPDEIEAAARRPEVLGGVTMWWATIGVRARIAQLQRVALTGEWG